MNLSSFMRVDGYAVRKSPSTIGFHTWLGCAAKRLVDDSERKQNIWLEPVQQPVVRVKFSTSEV